MDTNNNKLFGNLENYKKNTITYDTVRSSPDQLVDYLNFKCKAEKPFRGK